MSKGSVGPVTMMTLWVAESVSLSSSVTVRVAWKVPPVA